VNVRVENVDWSCILNLEKKKSTGQMYLTFKRIKIRYRDPNDEIYFNHPFSMGNKMQLIPDIYLEKPLSEMSLATDMEAVKLPKKKLPVESGYVAEEDDIFDTSKEVN
jgi:hypothetical protein